MPANPKYLNKSTWQRFAKISSGIIGGYVVTALFHMCLVLCLPNSKEVLITSIFSFFLIWLTLSLVPFLFSNGWKIWGLYMFISIILFGIYSIGNSNNPFL